MKPARPPIEIAREVGWLRGFATRVLRDAADADDLTQETMIAALSCGRRPDALRPWLKAVLRNVARMDLRTRIRRRRREAQLPTDALVPSVEDAAAERESERLVVAAIGALPDPLRTTLVLHFYEGLSAAEIGRRLGVPATTVRSRLVVALERVRERLEDGADVSRQRRRRALMPPWLLGAWLRPRLPAMVLAAAVAVVGAGFVARAPRSAAQPARAFVAAATTRGGAFAGHELRLPAEAAARGEEPDAWALLVLDAGTLARVRAGLGDGVRGEIFARLRARVDADDPVAFSVRRLNYGRAWLAQSAALLHAITGDRRYAAQAYRQMMAVQAHGPEGDAATGEPFARATVGVALAFTYDWAQAGLAPAARAALRDRLRRAADAWLAPSSPKLDAAGSYLAIAARAAELTMRLALGEEAPGAERASWLRRTLRRHLDDGWGTMGLGPGGIEHAALGARFAIPAALAARSRGDDTLLDAVAAKQPWRLPLFALSPARDPRDPARALQLASGRAPSSAEDGGWLSLLAAVVPPAARPAYRHFVDRQMGALAPVAPDRRYDPVGAGQAWALLFYPDDVAPMDPVSLFGRVAVDEVQGTFFFRGGWRDADDLLVSTAADARREGAGWDSAEAFRLSIVGFGATFAGGPGNRTAFLEARGDGDAGVSTFSEQRLATTLLVDGQEFRRRGATGGGVRALSTAAGGAAVVDGGTKYRELGLVSAHRDVGVDLDDGSGGAVVTTLDRLRSAAPHEYTWQLAPGADVEISVDAAALPPTFTLTTPGGGWLHGAVTSPAGVRLVGGDAVRAIVRGGDVDLRVVMRIGRGPVRPIVLAARE